MPTSWTFQMKPVKRLLDKEMNTGGLHWVDPFAGMFSPAVIRNDLNPDLPAQFHMDALEFLKSRNVSEFDGGIYDPPYSVRQASECYMKFGLEKLTAKVTNFKYWKQCKDEIARIIKSGGKAICFGWNSLGLGEKRGFETERILLVTHGGGHNDTIVTVERKVQSTLEEVK